ncbi:hypothetical protein FQR65_LT00825 [Abscondita terminalis]|nr:hypothetical protein FQR65_LT00825 [Abscondita terminalis]
MSNCVFCNIVSGKQPTDFVYEDEEIIVFNDIRPAAKFHYLAIPKKHIQDVNSLTIEDIPFLERLIAIGKNVLKEAGCSIDDARIGFHVPPFNSIAHLHLHFIAPVSDLSFWSRIAFRPNTWWFATAEAILENLKSKQAQ